MEGSDTPTPPPADPPPDPRQPAQTSDLQEIGRWLWRLFVLSPAEARAWPRWLNLIVLRPLRTLGIRLGLLPAPRSDRPSRPRAATDTFAGEMTGTWAFRRRAPLPPTRLLNRLASPYLQRAAVVIDRADAWLGAWYLARGQLTQRLILFGALATLWIQATTPLQPDDQLKLSALLFFMSLTVRRLEIRTTSLALIAVSLLASSRYVFWRLTQTLGPSGSTEWWAALGLLVAESYTWIVMVLGYLQNVMPLHRGIAVLPEDRAGWPSVDVFIPTYSEPLAVVKPAILAALSLDWPQQKLNVWMLDDGRRAEFREFALAAGARYLTRPDNSHAKAGNLNHALARSQGEYVAIFDCDHIPVRSFLTDTMGWFLLDQRCALVQTPHHFFSPDPFERNLGTFRQVPSEGSLFYGLVQDGNDLWNASYFCGSCAVLKRGPLLEIGGVATDTVTEDAHTALRLHRSGYSSAYVRRILAAGLATESLSSHVAQRARWARGMAQIFRIDNPLFGRGLSWQQRLCYLNAMLHFFSGLPRLVFLTAPLAYLFFEFHVITATTAMLFTYALPHLVQAAIANSHLQGRFRHSLWNEAYESALSWYIALPTLAALVNPRLGRFNVTAKGGLITKSFFDWRLAAPYMVIVGLNLAGVAIAIPRLMYWNIFESETVVINLVWTLFNLTLMGAVLGVATEKRQVRGAARVVKAIPARLHLPGAAVVECRTADFSLTGLRFAMPPVAGLPAGSHVGVELDTDCGAHVFRCEVMSADALEIRLRTLPMSIDEERRYVAATFGRPDVWDDWSAATPADRPLASLAEVLSFGATGYLRVARLLTDQLHDWVRPPAPAAAPHKRET